jgi:hypothetical protein
MASTVSSNTLHFKYARMNTFAYLKHTDTNDLPQSEILHPVAELLGLLHTSANTGAWLHSMADPHSLVRFEPKRIDCRKSREGGRIVD